MKYSEKAVGSAAARGPPLCDISLVGVVLSMTTVGMGSVGSWASFTASRISLTERRMLR